MAERAHPKEPGFQGTIFEKQLKERYEFCKPFINNKIILDIPCGTGWGTSLFSQTPSKIYGLDISFEALKFSKENYDEIFVIQGNMESIPLNADSFDVVICLEGLEHIFRSQVNNFIKEVTRILRTQGKLILTVPLITCGRHSGNPYHYYEYHTKEITELLVHNFEVDICNEINGADSLELQIVCTKKSPALPIIPINNFSYSTLKNSAQWLSKMQTNNGFSFSQNGNITLLTNTFGLLLLEGFSNSQNWVNEEKNNNIINELLSCQDSASGLFIDPLLEKYPIKSKTHDEQYIVWQSTYFAIHALDTINVKPNYPLSFLEKFLQNVTLVDWLNSLDWHNPWLESNRIMFLLFFILFEKENNHKVELKSVYFQILDWLDANQDIETGLWGMKYGASKLNAVAAAYHFIPFYEYVFRPIQSIEKMIDSVLSIQNIDGLFGASLGGGACEDEDAVGLLATFYYSANYRKDEIKKSLIRSFWAIFNLQNEDGGFGYANRPHEKYCFSSWETMCNLVTESDSWSTWFRLTALATIKNLIPEDLPEFDIDWKFRKWPTLGYQRFHQELTGSEKEYLPIWFNIPLNRVMKINNVYPMVSVIIPCFNLGKYIPATLASVSNQTYDNVELIIVNNGSTDDFTCLYLKALEEKGFNIVNSPNCGHAAAKNLGIENSSGVYICCLDPGDIFDSNFLQKTVEVLEKNENLGFVTSFYKEFDEASNIIKFRKVPRENFLVENRAIASSLFKKNDWLNIGQFDTNLEALHDWDFWISILKPDKDYAIVLEIIFFHRVWSGSRIDNNKLSQFSGFYRELVHKHKQWIMKEIDLVLGIFYKNHLELIQTLEEVDKRTLRLSVENENLVHSNQELLNHNKWLEEQRAAWEKVAGEFQVGNQWLEEQRAAWEKVAGEFQVGNQWLDEQRAAWEKAAGDLIKDKEELVLEIKNLKKKQNWWNWKKREGKSFEK